MVPSRGWTRVTVTVSTFLVLVGAVAVATYRRADHVVRGAAYAYYQHRPTVLRPIRAPHPRPDVLWLGDSTTMSRDEHPSYVPMVEAQLGGPGRVRILKADGPGMDFFAYWSLAGRVAAERPKLAVLVANLRNFVVTRPGPGFNDLTAELDLADLPRTLALPYWMRGLTAPGLVLGRALRTQVGEDVFLTFVGTRRTMQSAAAWDVLGPATRRPELGELAMRFVTTGDRLLASYDRPLDRSNPLMDFVATTVKRLTRDAIAVVVLVPPYAWELAVPKHYDAARFAGRIATLRAVVEENGGRLVDLHRALPKTAFRDTDCHLTAAGAAEMARLITPVVRQALRGFAEPTP